MQAIIYTRGSTKGQDETHGAQITNCMQWISREGLQLKGVYSEAVSGGARLDRRKVLTSAISELEQGDIFVVSKRSRFGRDLVEIRRAEDQIKKRGARVYSLELGFNETINDNFQHGIRDLMNEDEKKRISQRTSEVMEYLISEGRFTGRAPLGFTIETREDGKKYITPDETETNHVEMVKTWKREGLKWHEIQALCESKGITSRDGSAPSQATISRWTKDVPSPAKIKTERVTNNPNLLGRKARPRLEDQHAGLLALIKTHLAQGLSHAKITNEVELAGYKTSKNKPIRKSQITAIIARNKEEL